MKYITFILLIVFSLNTRSQNLAPDITLTDIHGVTRNLYSELDAGKQVILEFFMTTCGTCQINTAELETFWQNNGYNGDSLWVWSIEINNASDSAIEAFYTQYPATFPAFSTKNDTVVIASYNVTYAPMYISICPNRYMKTVVMQSIVNDDIACPTLTGIENLSNNSPIFKYFQNDNSLMIHLPSDNVYSSMKVYSVNGELVMNKALSENKSMFYMNNVTPGIYFVNIISQTGEVVSGKFIKTN